MARGGVRQKTANATCNAIDILLIFERLMAGAVCR